MKVTIAIKGIEHELHYDFGSMEQIGMEGFADGAGLQRAIERATQKWSELVLLIAAGLRRPAGADNSDITETIRSWDVAAMKRFVEKVPLAFGSLEESEGEQSGPPANSSDGTSAEPSLVLTSA